MLFSPFLLNIYDLLWKCCECSTSLELIDYYKWVKIAKYGRENIGTIETREKKKKKKNFFGSSLFNKNDGKVKNYYYSLNEGTFVILLLKVIFFPIYIFFSFLYFFPQSYCRKLISFIFFVLDLFISTKCTLLLYQYVCFSFFFFFFLYL